MTRLPELRDELAAAASRRHARALPARRSGRVVLLAAAVLLALTATAGAVAVLTGVVGGEPSAPYPRIAGEEDAGMVRTKSPVVLAVSRLPSGERVELVGYRMRGLGGKGELLCLDLLRADGTMGGGCDYEVREGVRGLIGTGTTRQPGPTLAVGLSRSPVAGVDIKYRTATGRTGTRAATLLRVPAEVARRLGADAFTYYIGELPPRVQTATAVGRDGAGRRLWRSRFPGP